jgi:hypothetical protein
VELLIEVALVAAGCLFVAIPELVFELVVEALSSLQDASRSMIDLMQSMSLKAS